MASIEGLVTLGAKFRSTPSQSWFPQPTCASTLQPGSLSQDGERPRIAVLAHDFRGTGRGAYWTMVARMGVSPRRGIGGHARRLATSTTVELHSGHAWVAADRFREPERPCIINPLAISPRWMRDPVCRHSSRLCCDAQYTFDDALSRRRGSQWQNLNPSI
jgi:hypothetical protein